MPGGWDGWCLIFRVFFPIQVCMTVEHKGILKTVARTITHICHTEFPVRWCFACLSWIACLRHIFAPGQVGLLVGYPRGKSAPSRRNETRS